MIYYIYAGATDMKETKYRGYFADEKGIIYSNKSGIIKPLKQRAGNNGYLYVTLYNGKEIRCNVHRLIVETFIREPDKDKSETVNHIDGNKLNNSLENLEIISCSENVKHSYRIGLHKVGENHERSKFSDKYIMSALNEIKKGNSVNSVAKKYGISQSYLNKIKNGIYRKSINDERGFND